jgi:hypothetical protein
MKKLISILLVGVILLAVSQVAIAEEQNISLFANPIFDSASVTLNQRFTAEFTASTNEICATIFVSSCVLQKQSGTKWVNAGELSVPSYVATNTSGYGEIKNYSGEIPSGGTYRLKVVFRGGNETVTRYSNSQSK